MTFVNAEGNPVDINFEKEEQTLVRKYVPRNATVLELGARYGTVSCVISEVLADPTRHVAVDPDSSIIGALEKNRDANGGKFHIFNGVVSNKKYELVRHNKPYEFIEYTTSTVENSEGSLNTASLQEIQDRYSLKFDCIVADCEGFMCDFFDENIWFLDQVKTIIFEKDGSPWEFFKERYDHLEKLFIEKGFQRVFSIPHIPPHAQNNPHFHNVWVKRPRVFITGGSGFIGKHLVRKIPNATVYSRSTGGDILDMEHMHKAMRGHDVVVHLAALVQTTGVFTNPSEYVNTNIIGSLNVVKACIDNNVKKIINLSSAAVYADGSVLTPEDENVVPSTFYGMSKLATEEYLRIITEIEHVNIRTALVYGPGDNQNRVLNKFMESDRILIFKGGGTQVLDYIHVEDLCDFIVHCLDNETGTFNVSCGEPIDTEKLAQIIGKDIIYEDVEPGECSKITPSLKRTLNEVKGVSLSNAKALLTGWRPKHSISNILDDYF